MTGLRAVAVASLGFVLGGQPAVAQAPFSYREYALEASVASVVTISAARESDARTLHERPARIQELEWRVPYGRSGSPLADPVRDIRFSFFNDQLYQVVVTYERDRTEGLTNEDLIESLSAIYGTPLLLTRATSRAAIQPGMPGDAAVVAQWEDAAGLLTLALGGYPPQYQLVLVSKALHAQARAAITEAVRLDAREAPERERDRRTNEAAAAQAAGRKARILNKAAFRP